MFNDIVESELRQVTRMILTKAPARQRKLFINHYRDNKPLISGDWGHGAEACMMGTMVEPTADGHRVVQSLDFLPFGNTLDIPSAWDTACTFLGIEGSRAVVLEEIQAWFKATVDRQVGLDIPMEVLV